ncbi:Gfo/Idh/MocA family oxidoreductase [Pantoea endophytica]|uniref:Gfo/Idh/MocA family oxidoreductase n=1 Tax=Pantoea endophytica TaxID=92488 RepID=UPI0030159CA9
MKIKLGFIGNGKSTNRYHIPFLKVRKEQFSITSIYCRNTQDTSWEALSQVNYTSDLDAFLNDENIDVVVICLPSNLHYEYAKKVIEHGKHCIVEKPFAQTVEQASELFKLSKSKGVHLQCYQNRRFDSDFLTVQEVIESGLLGEVFEVEMHYDYFRPDVPGKLPFDKLRSYFYGHGCHTLDQVISYFGPPENVHYDVRQLLGPGKFNDYFDVDFFYGRLKVSIKSSYFRAVGRPSFVVYGTKGKFEKYKKDRQEEHLKLFYMPGMPGFGEDNHEDYGTLSYYDDDLSFHEEKVKTVTGDYGRYYDHLYATLKSSALPLVTEDQTLLQIGLLEKGVNNLY